jgi:preprotein translocase subunit SecF
MNLRQKIQVMILLTLILFAFASYHEGSGNTAWLQWLSVISIAAFTFVFDLTFTNDSQFIFDPDAENWRRKTVREHFRSSSVRELVVRQCGHCVDFEVASTLYARAARYRQRLKLSI